MRRFVPPGGIEETIALCVRRVFGRDRFAKHLQTYLTKHYKDDGFFERELLWLAQSNSVPFSFSAIRFSVPCASTIDSLLCWLPLRCLMKNTYYIKWKREQFDYKNNSYFFQKWNKTKKRWNVKNEGEYSFWPLIRILIYKYRRRHLAFFGPKDKSDEVITWAIDNGVIANFSREELGEFIKFN